MCYCRSLYALIVVCENTEVIISKRVGSSLHRKGLDACKVRLAALDSFANANKLKRLDLFLRYTPQLHML